MPSFFVSAVKSTTFCVTVAADLLKGQGIIISDRHTNCFSPLLFDCRLCSMTSTPCRIFHYG